MRPGAEDADGAAHRQHAPLPTMMKNRLVGLGLDLAETVHAAHIVHAVHHATSLGFFARPAPTMRIARDQFGKLRFAPAFGSGRTHRAQPHSASRPSNPKPGSRSRPAASRRNPPAPRAVLSRRASGRRRTCTRSAAGRAHPSDNTSTTCTRSCCAPAACSRRRSDARRPVPLQ